MVDHKIPSPKGGQVNDDNLLGGGIEGDNWDGWRTVLLNHNFEVLNLKMRKTDLTNRILPELFHFQPNVSHPRAPYNTGIL